ncbi:MAG: DNA polymerase III subunit delta [candidate division KSB1 bacterium]|nr:DNA polymerase III subunit delta [candidate division KSB1 bacterium]MDZ7293834.1 DNA polymerase III subunit delta [candidate division KSB1 bacterium]MDZ7386669.1 DNA polymerase III subunit delta [candidate division KSB1 bacterium]MDZ7393859.1 DNA polymerase III subunit delta [candidate division KSB1 bacterium]MDZ7412177.1 DNA polymerase III subunit delta [candidate division KSB1 bacterium]
MDYAEARAAIEQGKVTANYLLLGPEDFLAEDLVHRLLAKALQPGDEELNLDVFYAGDADPAAIVNAASAYPMGASCRVVLVKEVEHLGSAALEMLASYARRPSPNTCLIMIGESLDVRLRGARALREAVTLVDLPQLREKRAQEWVRSYLAEQGVTISEEALRLLHESTGNSLRALVSELTKVLLNIHPRTSITDEDVANTIGVTRGFTVWELCDSVGRRDLRSAHLILRQLLDGGASATALVATLASHFRRLTVARGLEGRVPRAEIAEKLEVREFFVEKYMEQSRRFAQAELRSAFEALLAADAALKSGSHRDHGRLVLEILLLRLIGIR